jgi:hypothetical protein
MPWEVGIPTYHFGTHQNVGISSSRVLFRVFFPSMLYVKKAFGLFVILTWRMCVAITSLPRDKLPPFKRVLLFCNLYSFCNFTSVIESKFIVYMCFFHISMCIISSSHKSGSSIHGFCIYFPWVSFQLHLSLEWWLVQCIHFLQPSIHQVLVTAETISFICSRKHSLSHQIVEVLI